MDVIYKVQTDKSFKQAIEDLKTSLGNYKFGVLWQLDFKEKLREKGLDFDKNFEILEVCNPSQAKIVLNQNIEAGYFLPCKIVVYEKDDSVFIGMPRPTELIGMIRDDKLAGTALEVENQLKSAINDAR